MRPARPHPASIAVALAACVPSVIEAQAPPVPVMDSVRAEIAVGRHWHASLALEPLHRAGALDPDGLLVLARARAGYRNWEGVAEVLAGAEWLDGVPGGEAWVMLGRAHESAGEWDGAARAYSRALASGATSPAVRLRLARVRWRAGDRPQALADLDAMGAAEARSWMAWELLGPAVETGDTAATSALLARLIETEVHDRAWEAAARSRWMASDTAGALAAYQGVLRTEEQAGRRAVAHRVVGAVRLARGDSAAARESFLAVFHEAPGSGASSAAAAHLVDLGGLDAGTALTAARALDRAGDGRRALVAFDRYVATVAGEPDPAARVERARLMSTVADRREAAIAEFRELGTHPDPAVGARTLELWAALRSRQGRTSDEATIRGWLVERYPNTSAAADIVFFRGDDAHDRQDWTTALGHYRRVIEMAPTLAQAGLSRMRAAQILLHRGDIEGAAGVFEQYLRDFPSGARWEEAAYWAARTRLELGDSTSGLVHLDRLQAEEPFSYYTVLAADLLGRPFTTEGLPDGPDDAGPEWLGASLADLDVLDGAGLGEGVEACVDRLVERARASGADALYALADSLNARGRSLRGINLGWELRRSGEPWTLRLLRIVYPFPYREMVLREAREWGVDPFLLAALIRQESAWVADIVSSAGAIGLMQVMPETGRGLARSVGPESFTVASLETPEVNLHLGAHFLVDLLARFGPDLPLALSAYNAGPTRAVRWRTFPEAGDPLRFTERIPFGETRGYVKNVTRNLRLYEALWGPRTRLAR